MRPMRELQPSSDWHGWDKHLIPAVVFNSSRNDRSSSLYLQTAGTRRSRQATTQNVRRYCEAPKSEGKPQAWNLPKEPPKQK